MSGEVMTIHAKCPRCEKEKTITNVSGWERKEKRTSGKRGPRINQFNLEMVAAVFLNGGTYTTYLRQRQDLGLHAISKKGYRTAEKEVIRVIERLAEEQQQQFIREYQTGARELNDISGDCGWTHRRNSAAGTYSLIDLDSGNVVYEIMLRKRVTRTMMGKERVITKGNYFGTSHGMEGEGFRQGAMCLEDVGLLSSVKRIARDNDSSIGSMLALHPSLQHIKVHISPAHTHHQTCTHREPLLAHHGVV
jgi:hypothetical protein